MFIDVVPNGRSASAVLLRESYRDGSKVKKRTLANLSKLDSSKNLSRSGLLVDSLRRESGGGGDGSAAGVLRCGRAPGRVVGEGRRSRTQCQVGRLRDVPCRVGTGGATIGWLEGRSAG